MSRRILILLGIVVAVALAFALGEFCNATGCLR